MDTNDKFIKLWEQNIGLIYKIKNKHFGGMDDDEYEQCARIGLMNAIDTYDSDKGKFSTHLFNRIRYNCLDFLTQERRQTGIFDTIDGGSGVYQYSDKNNVDFIDMAQATENSEMVIDRFMYGMTLKEISQKNNVSIETARKRINSSIDVLFDKLDVL